MLYTLNVKGTEAEAVQAAEGRGLTVKRVHAVMQDSATLIAEGSDDGTLQRWFAEQGYAAAPYPAGTLLLFREGE
jgi:hypothetical protein